MERSSLSWLEPLDIWMSAWKKVKWTLPISKSKNLHVKVSQLMPQQFRMKYFSCEVQEEIQTWGVKPIEGGHNKVHHWKHQWAKVWSEMFSGGIVHISRNFPEKCGLVALPNCRCWLTAKARCSWQIAICNKSVNESPIMLHITHNVDYDLLKFLSGFGMIHVSQIQKCFTIINSKSLASCHCVMGIHRVHSRELHPVFWHLHSPWEPHACALEQFWKIWCVPVWSSFQISSACVQWTWTAST